MAKRDMGHLGPDQREPEDVINFGLVPKSFIVGSGIPKELGLEKQRAVVIQQSTGSRHSNWGEYLLVFFKDLVHRKKPLFEPITLSPEAACGIKAGTIDDKKSKEPMSYVALIFYDITLMLTFKSDVYKNNSSRWIAGLDRLFGHVHTWNIILQQCPEPSSTFHRGCSVLLSVTKHRLSISDRDNHHRCLCSWPLVLVVTNQLHTRDDNTLSLTVMSSEESVTMINPGFIGVRGPRGKYSFVSRLTDRICDQIRDTIQRSVRDGIIQPIYSTIVTHHQPDLVKRLRPSNLRAAASGSEDADGYMMPVVVSESQTDHYENRVMFRFKCEKCNALYWKYQSSEHFLSQVADHYNLDLNDYVRKHPQLVEKAKSWANGNLNTCASDLIYASTARPVSAEAPPLPPPRALCRGSSVSLSRQESSTSQASGSSPTQLGQSPNCRCPEAGNEHDIFKTLDHILRSLPPAEDTLELPHCVRVELCMRLYQPSIQTVGGTCEDWQFLAEYIGLTADAIAVIALIVKNHSLPYPAAEVVLRHWQWVFNLFGVEDNHKCLVPCSKQELLQILKTLGRRDLLELIEIGRIRDTSS